MTAGQVLHEARSTGPWRLAAARFRTDRVGAGFLALLVVLVALCLAAPLYASAVAGTGPLENHLADTVRLGGRTTNVVALDGTPIGPTWRSQFLLGADANGRDVAVRLLYGIRNSLLIGGGAAVLAVVLGAGLGLLAGSAGGRLDTLIMRGLDIVWSFPVLLLGVAVGTALAVGDVRFGPLSPGSTAKVATLALIGIGSVPFITRPVRSQVRVLRTQPFVDAAMLAGSGRRRIMTSELLPNLAFSLIALFTVLLANAIVFEAALSFLGAGVRPPEPSLGSMLRDGLKSFTSAPHLLLVPTVALMLLVLSVSLVGDAVRRALDPYASPSTTPHA